MTPDGTPSHRRNQDPQSSSSTPVLRTLGWTMSTGSARVLTDIIRRQKADIETADLARPDIGTGCRVADDPAPHVFM